MVLRARGPDFPIAPWLLRTSGRAELFVWLDVSSAQAALATLACPPFDQKLPAIRLPSLPAGVTAVWAAGLADWPRPAAAVLRYDGQRWSTVDRPVCTFDQLDRLVLPTTSLSEPPSDTRDPDRFGLCALVW